jgi:hypothetical protein
MLTAKAQCEKRKVDRDVVTQDVEGGDSGFESSQNPAIPDGIAGWDDEWKDQGGGDEGNGGNATDAAIDQALLVTSDTTGAEGQTAALMVPDVLIDPALLAISEKMLVGNVGAEGLVTMGSSAHPATSHESHPTNILNSLLPAAAPPTGSNTCVTDAIRDAAPVIDGDGLEGLAANNLDTALPGSGVLLEAFHYLQGKGWGSGWTKCIQPFVEFEKAHGFPVSTFLEYKKKMHLIRRHTFFAEEWRAVQNSWPT